MKIAINLKIVAGATLILSSLSYVAYAAAKKPMRVLPDINVRGYVGQTSLDDTNLTLEGTGVMKGFRISTAGDSRKYTDQMRLTFSAEGTHKFDSRNQCSESKIEVSINRRLIKGKVRLIGDVPVHIKQEWETCDGEKYSRDLRVTGNVNYLTINKSGSIKFDLPSATEIPAHSYNIYLRRL